MDDVLKEFASVDVVLKHMLEWKNKYLESYTEAYVNVCLPKLLGPFVRLELLTWNPLEVYTYKNCYYNFKSTQLLVSKILFIVNMITN